MRKLLPIIVCLLFVPAVAGCGGPAPKAGDEAGPSASATLPEATQAVIMPTNTPMPPPPTPTPLPTKTPAPTDTPAPTQATEATEGEGAKAVEEPTPVPTTPPESQVTDVMDEIPAGPFTMGTNEGNADEMPAHEVNLDTFYMDRFEVTNADFAAFVDATSYETDAEKNGATRIWRDEYAEGEDNHPVVRVTWNDATAYCEWLGKRLPTEAEWEKAAGGPDSTLYPWGNDWDASMANVKETGLRGTTAVGSYPANGYGLHDIAGNVWEWTADWYLPYPGNEEPDEFYGEKFRIIRGGGWFEEAPQVVVFNRNAADPNTTSNDDLGFRCAK